MNEDVDFWLNLKWPAAPNESDRKIFKFYQHGRTLLLGSTKLLLPLCDQAWDLNPLYDDPKLIARDWFSLDQNWDTIMLDGGLSYGKEFTDRLLPIDRKSTRLNSSH